MMLSFQDQRQLTRTDSVTEDGTGVIVAVCDTGISDKHPLLQGKVLKKFDFTGTGPEDHKGHGTGVASIIANLAPAARFISCKVLDDSGNGNLAQLMEGVEAAINEGATIINMSLSGGQDCLENGVVARFFDTLEKQENVMFIAACGNEGPEKSPRIPALARGVIAAGALESLTEVAGFSSRGPVCGSRIYPDVSSFGVDIEQATIDGGTRLASGTSFSCPMISGQLALVQQRINATIDREGLEILLEDACLRLVDEEKNNNSGWGILDSKNAVIAAENLLPPSPPIKRSNPVLISIGIAGAVAVAIAVSRR